MKVLALLIALTASLSSLAEGFNASIWLNPYSQVNQGSDNSNNANVDLFLKYSNIYDHNFELRSGIQYSAQVEETLARDVRLRHTFTLAKMDGVTFGSDFRLLFQGEDTALRGVGELNRMRFGPSVMFTTDVESTSLYLLVKPILGKFFKDQRFSLDEDTLTQTPVINYDAYNLVEGGMSFGRWTIIAGFGYQMKWNSFGDQVDDGYEIYEEIAYAPNKNVSFTFGHLSSSSLYDNDGRRNFIAFAQPDGDLFYGRFVFNF